MTFTLTIRAEDGVHVHDYDTLEAALTAFEEQMGFSIEDAHDFANNHYDGSYRAPDFLGRLKAGGSFSFSDDWGRRITIEGHA